MRTRTRLWPHLTSPRCTHHSISAGLPRWGRVPPDRPGSAHRRLTTASRPAWSLTDLPRVSEKTSPLICHLTSANPYYNLSIEHFLLTRSHPESRILLFYTNRPCVVIGRNQNPWLETDIKKLQDGLPSERQSLDVRREAGQPTQATPPHKSGSNASAPIDLVRRRSGGGTVFHDSGNLNYSVIIPNTKSFKRSTHAEMVVRALSDSAFQSSPYDFRKVRVNDRNDIVMQRQHHVEEWMKVSGSAFKLTRGRALHHGTLLYSSPYLDMISDLLRSPGRDLIRAKGVESVRSKVANLAWTADADARQELREEITEAIIREFWNMYGNGEARRAGWNEVTLDSDDAAEIPEIAAGVEELMSDAWRFEQTPRFDFSSGLLDGAEVHLQANRGVLEHLQLRSSVDVTTVDDQSGDDKLLVERRKEDFAREIKLHEVINWRRLITTGEWEGGGDAEAGSKEPRDGAPPSASPDGRQKISTTNVLPESLAQRIEAVFPPSSTQVKSKV